MSMDDTTNEGRTWALVSYAGLLMCLPLGLVPLAQKDDAFSLFHAKNALGGLVAFVVGFGVVFLVSIVAGIVTCGLSNLVDHPGLSGPSIRLLLRFSDRVDELGTSPQPVGAALLKLQSASRIE